MVEIIAIRGKGIFVKRKGRFVRADEPTSRAVITAYAQDRKKGYTSHRKSRGGGERMARPSSKGRRYSKKRPADSYSETKAGVVSYARKTKHGWTVYRFKKGAGMKRGKAPRKKGPHKVTYRRKMNSTYKSYTFMRGAKRKKR